MGTYEQATCSSSMAVALNRGVSYRRQGSSGLIWADPLVEPALKAKSRRSTRASQAAPSISPSSSIVGPVRAAKAKPDTGNNISLPLQRSRSTGDLASAKGGTPPPPRLSSSPPPRALKQPDSRLLRWIKKSGSLCTPLSCSCFS